MRLSEGVAKEQHQCSEISLLPHVVERRLRYQQNRSPISLSDHSKNHAASNLATLAGVTVLVGKSDYFSFKFNTTFRKNREIRATVIDADGGV